MPSNSESARLARAKRRMAHEGLTVRVARRSTEGLPGRWYLLIDNDTSGVVTETDDLAVIENLVR